MRVKVVYQVAGVNSLLAMHEYQDVQFHIDQRHGALSIVNGTDVIMVYAAGDWRRVIDVGAFVKAVGPQLAAQQETASENPRRREAVRTIPKT